MIDYFILIEGRFIDKAAFYYLEKLKILHRKYKSYNSKRKKAVIVMMT